MRRLSSGIYKTVQKLYSLSSFLAYLSGLSSAAEITIITKSTKEDVFLALHVLCGRILFFFLLLIVFLFSRVFFVCLFLTMFIAGYFFCPFLPLMISSVCCLPCFFSPSVRGLVWLRSGSVNVR